MKIHLGTDHAGFELKEQLKAWLEAQGHEVVDHGAYNLNHSDDYPDFVGPAAQAVSDDPESKGVILGGSGQGEAMDANRFPHVRAAEYYGGTMEIVRLAREHNDANILSLGARFLTIDQAKEAVTTFIETPFSGEERHERRIEEIG